MGLQATFKLHWAMTSSAIPGGAEKGPGSTRAEGNITGTVAKLMDWQAGIDQLNCGSFIKSRLGIYASFYFAHYIDW